MTGKELCSLSKDEFLARAPAYVGDIVWAHLEILQKETNGNGSPKSNANSSNSSPTSTTNSNFPAAPSSSAQQQPTYTTLEPSCSTPTSSSTTATAVPTTAAMRYTTAPPPLQRGVPAAAAALPQGLPYPGGEYNSTGEIHTKWYPTQLHPIIMPNAIIILAYKVYKT